jgi:hypothetical protein
VKRKSPAGKAKRPSYEHEKILLAATEECAEARMKIDKLLLLSPIEIRKRLSARMRKWGFTEDEIPEERSFRECFKRLKSDPLREVGILQEA